MHPDHSISSNISAANRRHDLHPFPVRQPAQSSNATQFAASLAVPRKVTVSASTAQCHGHSNLKAPELSERLSSASQMLFGALLSNFVVKSVLTMLVRAATKLSPASYLPPLEKLEGLVWISCGGVVRLCRGRSGGELQALYQYLADKSQPWSIAIGHTLSRDPTSISLGDTSQVAGGAYCEPLSFWFDIRWSDYVRDALHLHHKHPRHVHINCLEFVVVVPQLAAVITLFESPLPPAGLANSLTASRPSKITSL